MGVTLLAVCGSPGRVWAEAESTSTREYQVKAAFTYHFITFVSGWDFQRKVEPTSEDTADRNVAIRVGIIGRDPFKDAFVPLLDRRVRGRRIQIKRFQGLSELESEDEKVERHPQTEAIKKCDLVFISASERKYISRLLKPLRNERILTLADTPGFLERGGIINFVMVGRNVKFEINTAGARRAKLTIRSQLLRLATRVIDEDGVEEE